MRWARWSVSLVVIIGLVSAAVAGAVIWLLLADPVRASDTFTTAVNTGDFNPVVQAIGAVIVDALKGLFKFL